MAFGLDDSKTTPVLLILLAGMVGYIGYTGAVIQLVGMSGLGAQREKVTAVADSIARFEASNDSAKRVLAQGSIEELRERTEQIRADLDLLRRLVPERSEVPNLLDDISTRAKIRGVSLAQMNPLPTESGPPPFDTQRYSLAVLGNFDEVGAFLADIASLPRIIVPVDLALAAANQSAAKALGDTTGALLEAKFQIRTYVKASGAAEASAAGATTGGNHADAKTQR
ncbi:MAG: type 4a pilus biogenesis protein PilO [Gemmatimonadota bacterium]